MVSMLNSAVTMTCTVGVYGYVCVDTSYTLVRNLFNFYSNYTHKVNHDFWIKLASRIYCVYV